MSSNASRESTAEIRTPTNIPDVVTLADTAEDFLARKFPEKEPLIEHLLHRRDLVALGARRRHGKTSFLTNMAVAMAIPVPDFLGHRSQSAAHADARAGG